MDEVQQPFIIFCSYLLVYNVKESLKLNAKNGLTYCDDNHDNNVLKMHAMIKAKKREKERNHA